MKNRPPTLTVSTQGLQSPSVSLPPGALGPTAPGSLRSRPLGARRRQPLNAGLFIANPDSSDDEDSQHAAVNGTPSSQTNAPSHSSGGVHQVSPQRSFRSNSPTRNSLQHSSPNASPVGQTGTIGRNACVGTPLPPIPPQQSGSTGSNSLPSASSSVSPGAPPTMNTTSRPLPILNAPNHMSNSNSHHVGASNPILSLGPLGSPLLSAFPLPSPSGLEMSASLSQNSTCNGSTGHAPSSASASRPMPPQPPPQPERHRDFGQKPRAFTTPTIERDRGTIGDARVNSIYREQPGSPNRALPPLPPMKAQSVPSPTAGQLNQLHGSSPSNHPSHYHPPHLFPPTPPTPAGPSLTRVSSPDDALHVPDRRQRSNSMFKVLLQVTTDNEQFSIVDITGVHTAEAIRERIFSKLRFRDEDYATLSLFRTDIGESPEPTPIANPSLLQLCQSLGDSRASLKFLVVQTGAPRSSSSMVPPPSSSTEYSNRGPPAIVTDMPAPPYTPDPHSSGHSKDGSLSSASAASMDRRQGSFHSISDAEDLPYYGARGMRQPTLSTSSASPIGSNVSRPSLHTNSSLGAAPVRVGSVSTPDLTRDPLDEDCGMTLPAYPANESRDMSATIRASTTSTPQPPPVVTAFPTEHAGPSSSASTSRSYSGASTAITSVTFIDRIDRATFEEMDKETKALILELAQEEQQRATRRQEQEMADAELALRTQQTEREHWQQEQERRQSEFDQVAADAAEAVRLQQQERLLEEQRHERLLEEQRQQEEERRTSLSRDSEADRAHAVAAERQIRRHLFQNQMATPGDYHSLPGPSAQLSYDARRPSDSQRERPWVPPYTPSSLPEQNGHAYGRAPSYEAAVAHPHTNEPGVRRTSNNMPPYAHHAETVPRPTEHRGSAGRQGRYATYGPSGRNNSGLTPVSVEFPSPHPSWPEPSPPISTSPDSSSLRRPSEATSSPPVHGQPQQGGYFPPRAGSDPRPTRLNRHDVPPRRMYSSDNGYGREVDISDSVSAAGTATSEAATIMPNEGTARPEDWQHCLEGMIGHHNGATRNPQSVLSSPEEATLFVPASRPQLTVNTTRGPPRNRSPMPTHYSADSSDSESNNDEEGRGLRQRSVNGLRRGGWRPDPEQLYDNLQDFFPEIDLDRPIVDPVVSSTPSTPNSESPRNTFEMRRPQTPEMVSAAVHAGLSNRSGATPARENEPQRVNPVRGAISAATAAIGGAFNRAENRKSIRNVAEHKKKSLQRNREREGQADRDQVIVANAAEERKIKRSSSMWGHRVVEVTPSRMSEIPATIPESPSGDGKPQTLNWVKGELIGRGSYGRVYHALNVTTGDVMAVKQVEIPRTERDRHDGRHQTMVEALRKEQGLLKNMYHPNVVAYLGFEEGTKYLSIFLEYVPGGTIGSIYRKPEHGRFEENLIKYFTGQILQGLEYLHSNNVQHRDLKSDNILVDANGVCKISDFGISKRTSDNAYESNLNTSMQGSIFWMAPEVMITSKKQIQGNSNSGQSGREDKTYSAKADIWSLGCVVVEMWTGMRPWGTSEIFHVMYASALERAAPSIEPEILETMSQTAVQFLYGKCLCWESKGRPTAEQLLSDPFVTELDPAWTWHNSRIGRAVSEQGREKYANASYRTNGRAAAQGQ